MKNNLILFQNYIKTTFRRMVKQPGYTLINMVGLTSGIMVFLLIFSYVAREYSYDNSWKDSEKIHRINVSLNFNGRMDPIALTSYNIAQSMKTAFPEVEASTMIFKTNVTNSETGVTVWYEDQMLELPSFTYADADFFKVFDYPFTEGNAETALAEPKSMVLSTELAKRLFDDTPALGKMLRINKTTYVVTGVIDKNHHLTHLEFDALVSLSTHSQKTLEEFRSDWFWLLGYTYVKFNDASAAEGFDAKLEQFNKDVIQPWIKEVNVDGSIDLSHEPVTHIHFNNSLQYDSSSNVNESTVKIFAVIAGFLLLIAAINYMNLATARSVRRAREIGIRKVAGAHRLQLIVQFLGESYLLTALSFALAWSFAELAMPYFNDLTGLSLSLSDLIFANISTFLILLLTFLLLGLLSGFYPAIVLSSFAPVKALRPGASSGKSSPLQLVNLRKILVVLQFVISTGMIIATFIVSSQLNFVMNHPKGIDSEQVMVVHFPRDSTLVANKNVIREQFLALPEVKQVSAGASLPGYLSGRLMFFVGDTNKPEVHTMNIYLVDHEFFDLFGIPVNNGRVFSRDYPNDDSTAFVVNQAAADYLGYDDPLAVEMDCGMGVKGKIVGVVKDFHYASLHSPIEPLVFILRENSVRFLAIKIQTTQMAATVEKVQQIWQEFDQKNYFHYTFLNDRYAKQYLHEQRMLTLFGYFSLIIVLISCLGLYGLSAFSTEQRTREIGIRKVLGGSPSSILTLLIKGFMVLVLIAGLISIPIVYYLMSEWLNEFAFRVPVSAFHFIAGFMVSAFIALATVLFQAFKALRNNPVDAIKYE
ncbi:MAG: putative FtsX-related transmembrane transport protein [Bacteroidetes bacterium]|nr:MAG: putative FtsX-related transmembrane transport protein [Bacteroidota bacterium]